MATIAASVAIAIVVAVLIKVLFKYWSNVKFSLSLPSPGIPYPIVGHSYLFFNVAREDILDTLLGLTTVDPRQRKIGAIIGNEKLIWYFHPEPTEAVLSSYDYISKSREYIYLEVNNHI